MSEQMNSENRIVDIMGKKYLWLGISLVYMIPFIIAIVMCFQKFGTPVKLGLDFTGGTLMEVTYTQPVTPAEIRGVFQKQGLEAQLTTSGDKTVSIRTKYLDRDASIALKEGLESVAPIEEKQFRMESVGPTIGKELLTNAMWALGLGILGILLYITFRYQFDFAMSAIVAMVHDVIVMIGLFAALSLTMGAEADGLLVVALLTIMGFSVHDTIVIFDRFRENLKTAKKGDTFEDVANRSVNQTFARSINTSLTLVLTLLPLVLFGGHSIFFFTLVMLVGVISGTWSSIFNAAPILVMWRDRGRNKHPKPAAA